MAKRRNKVIIIALVSLGTGALYALFVKLTGFGIPCPIRLMTGLECPGCGTSRMAMSLLRLDFVSAFRYNPAVFCLLPVMAACAARYAFVYVKYGRVKDRFADAVLWVIIGALVIFGALRNVL